ncbi:hypothetical protein ACWGBY_28125 [Streptomyces griseus]|uniref:Uncharacterized protein n=1 Tax=Streptomyces sp. CMC78 TaxID=3231512 RepID=A0AB33K951_9ACTN|nr:MULTISPECIES: hypothetical protein [Streptomyces]WSV23862.1 hypothetical protein OG554_27360 [Streptomyces fimicarius]MCI4044100.1 hypothetical protein [Streptomyces sp. TRM75563]MCX4711511.1 hypothetical protein [Streptomyces griseus]MDX5576692.1 hypothetical protein [Streptomyces sp. ID01-9D]WKN17232.1 hypothetical protein NEH83_25480 [Streptomyces sp. JUS-F4]
MISIIETQKMTDLSVVSACSLGLTRSSAASLRATGLSGISAARPLSLASLPVTRERNERPTEAPAAAVAKAAQAQAYAFAAAGAGFTKQTQHHHEMWAFRGPEPWSDPA